MDDGIQVIEPDWPSPPGVRVAFTLRVGGVSAAPFDSLNLGAALGDSPEAIAENRRRVREHLRLPSDPVWLEQVHGVDVADLDDLTAIGRSVAPASGDCGVPAMGSGVLVTESNVSSAKPKASGVAEVPGAVDVRGAVEARGAVDVRGMSKTPLRADAAVTRRPGQVCTIRVADCMPVVFAARDGLAVGAAHAGWRGLAGGVLEATVARLRVPPSQLLAWMGPAIGPRHFEVGDDVRTAFVAKDEQAGVAFVRNTRGRWQCDLYALARRRLSALGVGAVYGGGWCTFAEADKFFSYRRDGQCGRMVALVWMEPR